MLGPDTLVFHLALCLAGLRIIRLEVSTFSARRFTFHIRISGEDAAFSEGFFRDPEYLCSPAVESSSGRDKDDYVRRYDFGQRN